MRYRIVHRTSYTYATDVTESHSEVRMLPRDLSSQRCLARQLVVYPEPADLRERTDYFGNRVVSFNHMGGHRYLVVESTSEVETLATGAPAPVGGSWEEDVARLQTEATPECRDARQYVLDSPLVALTPSLREYASRSFVAGRSTAEAVHDLSGRIHEDFDFETGATTLATQASDALARRKGVCQDYAHVMIGCLRSVGVAARYVSGYIETVPPDGAERLVGADASHAWVSYHLVGSGWHDVDPTNHVVPAERHIVTAWGRDYTDVTPLKGVLFSDGGNHDLTVSVDVAPIPAST